MWYIENITYAGYHAYKPSDIEKGNNIYKSLYIGGNQSTFHQDHVELLHKSSCRRQRQYINVLQEGNTVRPPVFMKRACSGSKGLLDVDMM